MKQIFVDFDGVLLNTSDGFVRDFKETLIRLGASPELMVKFWKTQFAEVPEYKSRAYYLIEHPELLSQHLGIEDVEKAKREFASLIDNMPRYIFEDVMSFLEAFRGYDLFLITAGGLDWQMLKVEKSGLLPYFKEVCITDGATKVEMIMGLLDRGAIKEAKGFFIDDRGRETSQINAAFPGIATILLDRPGSRYSEEVSQQHDYLASNLCEAGHYIKNTTN